jgi:hypothetical protein
MLRHASCDNASVLVHMLEVIHSIGKEVDSTGANQELIRHIRLIQEESKAGSIIDSDRERISKSCMDLMGTLLT